MWTSIKRAVTDATVDRIVRDACPFENRSENRHFVEQGKSFFTTPAGLRHLHNIMEDLRRHVDLQAHMARPVIQHAYLLYKSPGPTGNATHLHQDRAYWEEIESRVTMFTMWFFLDDIGADKGCLKLDKSRRFDLMEDGFLFNNKPLLLPHETVSGKGFNRVIRAPQAEELERALAPIPGHKGDVVIFDAFDLHSSTPNLTSCTRRAMKIVVGDNLNKHLMSLDELHRHRPGILSAAMSALRSLWSKSA